MHLLEACRPMWPALAQLLHADHAAARLAAWSSPRDACIRCRCWIIRQQEGGRMIPLEGGVG